MASQVITPRPFQAGPRLMDGSDVNAALADVIESTENGITALASGGRSANTPVLNQSLSHIGTCATGGDSVVLPKAVPGKCRGVYNAGAASCQVFANGTDTINATAGSTGVALAAGKSAFFFCAKAGVWAMSLSA